MTGAAGIPLSTEAQPQRGTHQRRKSSGAKGAQGEERKAGISRKGGVAPGPSTPNSQRGINHNKRLLKGLVELFLIQIFLECPHRLAHGRLIHQLHHGHLAYHPEGIFEGPSTIFFKSGSGLARAIVSQ